MSKYRIINATTVKFGKYDDVLRVMAEREKGFWASLFSSGNTQFIISKESPDKTDSKQNQHGQSSGYK